MQQLILIFLIAIAALLLCLLTINNEGFGSSPKTIVFNEFNFKKLGDFKVLHATMRADWQMAQPGFEQDGVICVGDTNDWSKVANIYRNETYSALLLTGLDRNGVNVVDIMTPIGAQNGIPVYPSDNAPLTFNYLIKHPSQASSLMLMNCGTLSPQNGRLTVINGQYLGNNHNSRTDLIGPSEGRPMINEVYELYYALSNDNAPPIPGPQGPAGPAGPTTLGPVGPAGSAGSAGPAGNMGPVGPPGPIPSAGIEGTPGPPGPAGPKGSPGNAGPQGITGILGERGLAGSAGPAGVIGPQGPPGEIGPDTIGPIGKMGEAGTVGPMGFKGVPGKIGPQGPEGPMGIPGYGGNIEMVRLIPQKYMSNGEAKYSIKKNMNLDYIVFEE